MQDVPILVAVLKVPYPFLAKNMVLAKSVGKEDPRGDANLTSFSLIERGKQSHVSFGFL